MMLDDLQVLQRKDSQDMLGFAARQYEQAARFYEVFNPDHDERAVSNIVLVGMGGSGLANALLKTWLGAHLTLPCEVIREYDVPGYVSDSTLVIVSSCSGNTEEAYTALNAARQRGAQVAIVTGGGRLLTRAVADDIAHIQLTDVSGVQSKTLTVAQVRAVAILLGHFGAVNREASTEIADLAEWLKSEMAMWTADVSTARNYAKQLALHAVGKTPVFYGGELTRTVAYKWKVGWNENAKNIAFCGEYPEGAHNELAGWTSHPIEKPFAVFDIISSFERERVLKCFALSNRLLSGKRPNAVTIELQGDTLLKQLLWGSVLADFASIYVGIMNNVDPGPVPFVTKFKRALDE